MTKLYGINNCDTVKKAKTWLTDQGIEFEFIDFRKDGLSSAKVKEWVEAAGIELVLNKRGTTWRKLSDAEKALDDNAALIELMTENPTLIKRPVLETHNQTEVGFKADQYQSLFS